MRNHALRFVKHVSLCGIVLAYIVIVVSAMFVLVLVRP